jgi:hypothetical protein
MAHWLRIVAAGFTPPGSGFGIDFVGILGSLLVELRRTWKD